MNGKQVIKKLEKLGWRVTRVKGSHHQMANEDGSKYTTIPVHGSKDIDIDLIRKIQRDTGVQL